MTFKEQIEKLKIKPHVAAALKVRLKVSDESSVSEAQVLEAYQGFMGKPHESVRKVANKPAVKKPVLVEPKTEQKAEIKSFKSNSDDDKNSKKDGDK